MYDKNKTIKGYMGGGYMKPMGYQTGGYIPGLSRARYLTGLDRDKRIAQEEFEANAEKVAKEQKYRGLLGKIGSFAGTALGAALAAPTGGMSVLAGKALGSAIGKGAGELVGGSFVDTENLKKSSTGLYKDDFEYLEKQGREAQDLGGLAERSAIAGATTYGLGKAGEVADFGKKAYAEKFGMDALENLGMAGETDPLLSSLTKDVSTARAGATDILGDLGSERLPLDFSSTTDYDTELAMLFDDIAGQEQVGQNVVGGGMLNLNQGGYVQGYEDGGSIPLEDYVGLTRKMITAYGENPDTLKDYNKQGGLTREGYAKMLNLEPESLNIDTLSFRNPSNYLFEITGKNKDTGAMLKGTSRGQNILPIEELLGSAMDKEFKDPFEKMDMQMKLNDIKKLVQFNKGGYVEEYKGGGLINMNSYARRIL